jgi:hypothetical protein
MIVRASASMISATIGLSPNGRLGISVSVSEDSTNGVFAAAEQDVGGFRGDDIFLLATEVVDNQPLTSAIHRG